MKRTPVYWEQIQLLFFGLLLIGISLWLFSIVIFLDYTSKYASALAFATAPYACVLIAAGLAVLSLLFDDKKKKGGRR